MNDTIPGHMIDMLRHWRADTPGCERRNHLNNAGASLMPRPVSDAIHHYLQLESTMGGYEAADVQAHVQALTRKHAGVKCVKCHTTGWGTETGYPKDPKASDATRTVAARTLRPRRPRTST